jgi:hypothetical protein
MTVEGQDDALSINTRSGAGTYSIIFLRMTPSKHSVTSLWKFTSKYEDMSLDSSQHNETNLQFNLICEL